MSTFGFARRLLHRLSLHIDARAEERSARVAIRTAQLVISSAADNSNAISSAIRSMLRHAETVRGSLRSDLVTALQEATNHTRDKSLKARIDEAIADLQARSN